MPRRTASERDALLARAAAHPLRGKILALLRRRGPMTQTEVARRISAAPASARFHILKLEGAGFVRRAGVRAGPKGITEILFRAAAGRTAPRFATRHGTREDREMRRQVLEEHKEAHRAGSRVILEVPERFFHLGSWNLRGRPAELRKLARRIGRVVESFRTGTSAKGTKERCAMTIGIYPRT